MVKARTTERIAACWGVMGRRLRPGRFLIGDQISVLDLYVAVVSRWGPRRAGFYAAAPGLADCIRRVDDDPRLSRLWAERFPFRPGE